MKKILVAALVATTFAASAALTGVLMAVTAGPATAQVRGCPDDAPEGWKRPGGFCDSLNDKSSLSTPSRGPVPTTPINPLPLLGTEFPILLGTGNPCLSLPGSTLVLPPDGCF